MGSQPLDLEALREIFKDRRTHIAVGKVLELEMASDRSVLFAKCEILLQEREVIAKVAWDACGPSAGIFQAPQKEDLVLIEFAEGEHQEAFVTRRLSSKTDVIPKQVKDSHLVVRALAGKKAYMSSDTKLLFGKGGDTDPTEPLVLGNVLKTFLTNVLDAFLNSPSIGESAVGSVVLDPGIRSNLVAYKSQFLTTASTNIVSQLGFTERGT